MRNKVAIVIPNLNGAALLAESLESLARQTAKHDVYVVDNASTDGSQELIRTKFPDVALIQLTENRGFAGGVNPGIQAALDNGAQYVALFNNDAVADPMWLECLLRAMDAHPEAGIVTGKFLRWEGKQFDSTGDFYSIWGFSFPRGRDTADTGQFDKPEEIFGATGGASLYRCEMLKKIGLFDEGFFAYFEDVDISFRAQLAGWKVRYEPKATARHHLGSTSSKMGDFTRYHTIKNFFLLYAKNMPTRLYWKYLPRFTFAALLIIGASIRRGQFRPLFKATGYLLATVAPTARKRRQVQKMRRVSTGYIDSILYKSMPPTQKTFFALRRRLASMRGRA